MYFLPKLLKHINNSTTPPCHFKFSDIYCSEKKKGQPYQICIYASLTFFSHQISLNYREKTNVAHFRTDHFLLCMTTYDIILFPLEFPLYKTKLFNTLKRKLRESLRKWNVPIPVLILSLAR